MWCLDSRCSLIIWLDVEFEKLNVTYGWKTIICRRKKVTYRLIEYCLFRTQNTFRLEIRIKLKLLVLNLTTNASIHLVDYALSHLYVCHVFFLHLSWRSNIERNMFLHSPPSCNVKLDIRSMELKTIQLNYFFQVQQCGFGDSNTWLLEQMYYASTKGSNFHLIKKLYKHTARYFSLG